jgi:hypothetical protein
MAALRAVSGLPVEIWGHQSLATGFGLGLVNRAAKPHQPASRKKNYRTRLGPGADGICDGNREGLIPENCLLSKA